MPWHTHPRPPPPPPPLWLYAICARGRATRKVLSVCVYLCGVSKRDLEGAGGRCVHSASDSCGFLNEDGASL